MTPKEVLNPNNEDSSSSSADDGGWRDEEEKKAAAVCTLRQYGLLPETYNSPFSYTCITRLASRQSSWYSSSSSDDDSDDDYDSDNNNNNNNDGSSSRKANSGLHLEFETELVVGFRGALYERRNNTYGENCDEPPQSTEQQQERLERQGEEEEDEKWKQDEQVFQSNLSRRSIRFRECPQIQEYEPASFDLHSDLYYSCHQLQSFMNEYHHQQQQQLKNDNNAPLEPTSASSCSLSEQPWHRSSHNPARLADV